MINLIEQFAAYEKMFPPVDIASPVGTRIVFHGNGGYPNESDAANKALSVGQTYTLSGSSIGNWRSTFFLDEVPGGFNSVFFSPDGWTSPEPPAGLSALAAHEAAQGDKP